MTGSPLEHAASVLLNLTFVIGGAGLAAIIVVLAMRWRDLHWSWSAPALLPSIGVWPIDHGASVVALIFVATVTVGGSRWHGDDLRAGADLAAEARRRLTPLDALRRSHQGRDIKKGRWVTDRGLIVGRQPQGITVHVPVGRASGQHTLVVGATGSGKTVTQAWIAARLIDDGYGAVVIDPKGDALLRDTLHQAARRARRTFREWTPEGPAVYNPFAHGTDTELADKALAGETYTEPHYLRQAQRYLGHVTRALRAADRPVTLAALTEALDPDRLDLIARGLGNGQADPVHTYLDSLGPEQRRGLSGTRDRLAILAESDVAPFLTPRGPTRHNLDLLSAVQHGDVVLFRLDADRRPPAGRDACRRDRLRPPHRRRDAATPSAADGRARRRVLRHRSRRNSADLRPRPIRGPQPPPWHAGARRPAAPRPPRSRGSGARQPHHAHRPPPGRSGLCRSDRRDRRHPRRLAAHPAHRSTDDRPRSGRRHSQPGT